MLPPASAATVSLSKPAFLVDANWHCTIIRSLVSALMLSLYLWIGSGLVHLLLGLSSWRTGGWTHAAERMITDVVILLAALELIRTLHSYLEIGRVRVTFILDAALVVLIGELISLWYQEYTAKEVLLSMGVIVLLTLLRIATIKYSPDKDEI
jgi:uncharacterized membrane protein (DUF373 family)